MLTIHLIATIRITALVLSQETRILVLWKSIVKFCVSRSSFWAAEHNLAEKPRHFVWPSTFLSQKKNWKATFLSTTEVTKSVLDIGESRRETNFSVSNYYMERGCSSGNWMFYCNIYHQSKIHWTKLHLLLLKKLLLVVIQSYHCANCNHSGKILEVAINKNTAILYYCQQNYTLLSSSVLSPKLWLFFYNEACILLSKIQQCWLAANRHFKHVVFLLLPTPIHLPL